MIKALSLLLVLAWSQFAVPVKAAAPEPPVDGAEAVVAVDSLFAHPYVDLDEWRDKPVRHRYVHGGFTGTDSRFSYYFPPPEQYQGRFFQYITPVPDNENLSQGAAGEDDKIGFAIASGAYFIETNGGGASAIAIPGKSIDPSIGGYRANAAAARYSRELALSMYGGKRPYGYAFGGSGGGYRTIGGAENTRGVWDGFVPYVIGSPMAIPNVFTVRLYAMRVLDGKLAGIADAVDAGGGDPYAGLNAEQRAALAEVTGMGFPLRGWHAWQHLGLHAFAILFPFVVAADPPYFIDFWTQPGHEGFAPPPSLLAARVQHAATIDRLIFAAEADAMGLRPPWTPGQPRNLADNAWQALQGGNAGILPVAIRLDSAPTGNLQGMQLVVKSGAASGQKLPVASVQGDMVLPERGAEAMLRALKAGDQVLLDNSDFLAVQTYHRHQVPGPEYRVWDQFRNADGTPIYPQRPRLLGPGFALSAAGTVPTGNIAGKMIVISNLYDTEAFPWQADWYRAQVQGYLGNDTDKHFRLWYTDHANHGDSSRQLDPAHLVSYLGVLQQALRDVSAWVEQGVEPAPTTRYEIVDGQVVVPGAAAARGGIQPIVTVTADGTRDRLEVAAGTPVSFTGIIELPPDTGKIVTAAWDFDGSGNFAVTADLRAANIDRDRATVTTSHVFTTPGTYFAVLRAASQRQGDAATPFARVQNLGRVRVVVR